MASSVTTINRYTKTILEFKHKRKNIEKNLKIKQKLLDLESPDQEIGRASCRERV